MNLSFISLVIPDKMFDEVRWRGLFAVFGGFLIQLTLGSFYSFGNMMTYMTSYMRAHGAPNMTYTEFIAVQSAWGVTQGIVMPISGFLIRLVGWRFAMFAGCAIFSAGSALTYWTIGSGSLRQVAFTYGVVSAFGQGMALIPTMTMGMRWFPRRKGLAMGIVVGGFGGGAMLFNQIQTAVVNPDNVAVEKTPEIDGDEEYFTDHELLERVPYVLLVLAAIYSCVQFAACLMVTEPPDYSGEDELDAEKNVKDDALNVPVLKALRTKEFTILWLTRFSVVLITQTIAGFYKAFGQTFISDDHFLSFVGAVCSVFNCSGRLVFGLLMDKSSYKAAMITEATLLSVLMATLNETSDYGKVAFATWVWLIFLVFPGTYAIQPAVTTQTFGHVH